MTVTNGERREVAHELREHGLFESLMPLDKYLAWMYDVINCGRSVTSLTIRLADLIEPEPKRTCHIKLYNCTDSLGQKMHRCSECGALMTDDACFFEGELDIGGFSYCPNCGAKVVNE